MFWIPKQRTQKQNTRLFITNKSNMPLDGECNVMWTGCTFVLLIVRKSSIEEQSAFVSHRTASTTVDTETNRTLHNTMCRRVTNASGVTHHTHLPCKRLCRYFVAELSHAKDGLRQRKNIYIIIVMMYITVGLSLAVTGFLKQAQR